MKQERANRPAPGMTMTDFIDFSAAAAAAVVWRSLSEAEGVRFEVEFGT